MNVNPQIIAKAIYRLFREARDKEEEGAISRFVAQYIARRNLYGILPRVYREIEKIEKHEAGIKEVEVISAHKLPEAQKDTVTNFAAKTLGVGTSKIEPDFKIDKNIIGGLIVKTEDRLIDLSIGGRLRKLEERLRV
jgi:F-type H+-transporting ATPase subunit delta